MLSNRGDRLELLAGLIDTDGSNRKRGAYSFSNSNKQLAEDIIEFTTTPECRMVEKYGDKPEFYGYGQDKCFVFINFMKNYGSL